MAVRIRLKRMGRRHRPFFRLCAMDQRAPRDGRVLEELGTYDPSVPDVDARAVLNAARVSYWLSVGAQPTAKARVLIKKYGAEGTHLDRQAVACARLTQPRKVPDAGPAASPRVVPPPPATRKRPPAADDAAGQTPDVGTPASEAMPAGPAASTPMEMESDEASAEMPDGSRAGAEEPAESTDPEPTG